MKARKLFFIFFSCAVFFGVAVISHVSAAGPSKDRLAPPTILAPKDISEFRDTTMVEFKWRVVPEAKQYHVIIAKDRKFTRIMNENMEVKDFYYLPRNLDYGTYFFRISSIAEDGTEGPFSDTLSFIIVPAPPQPIPVK